MLTLPYVTVDVFTTVPFGGNPLAVIPDARGVSDALMQRIAREFNYSEVTFVLPPNVPDNTARIRIFTPTGEVPFAGHPNVGTAFVLGQEGRLFDRALGDTMRFEEGAGLIEVGLLRERDAIVGAGIVAPRPLTIDYIVEPSVVAACASLDVNDVVTAQHGPVMASVGLPFVLAEVPDLATLAKARPDMTAFAAADRRYPHSDIRFSLFLYTRTSTAPLGVRARMFAPLDNVFEDPATGSASAALAAYLVSLGRDTDLHANIVIEQGMEMGRPSVIEIHVHKASGTIREVRIEGRCVPVMRGMLQLSNNH